MIRIFGYLYLTFILLLPVACTHQIKLTYSPLAEQPKVDIKSLKSIRVKPFVDQRVTETLATTPNLPGGYMVTSEVVQMITEAIKVELANLGYKIVEEGGDFELSGKLLVLHVTLLPGLIKETAEGVAQISIMVKNKMDNSIVWSDIVSGKATTERAMAGDVETTINLALVDMIRNLVNSESFHEALK